MTAPDDEAPTTDREVEEGLPSLDPSVVEDDALLGERLDAWLLALGPTRDGATISEFETALQASLDPARWQLASRLLGLIRADADDRLLAALRWAFTEGRRFPLTTRVPS